MCERIGIFFFFFFSIFNYCRSFVWSGGKSSANKLCMPQQSWAELRIVNLWYGNVTFGTNSHFPQLEWRALLMQLSLLLAFSDVAQHFYICTQRRWQVFLLCSLQLVNNNSDSLRHLSYDFIRSLHLPLAQIWSYIWTDQVPFWVGHVIYITWTSCKYWTGFSFLINKGLQQLRWINKQ